MLFSIEALMSFAAVFIGAEEEAAAVVLLFLVGEILEGIGDHGIGLLQADYLCV